jgi:hypothetical protein
VAGGSGANGSMVAGGVGRFGFVSMLGVANGSNVGGAGGGFGVTKLGKGEGSIAGTGVIGSLVSPG